MFEAGKKFSYLIQFSSGQPTSSLVYRLTNQDGTVVLTNTVSITLGQLSYLVVVPAATNVLTKPLFEKMTLEWEYTTATEAISESVSYVIHTPIGFPVSKDGVRNKIGVTNEELLDEDINLFEGYLYFQNLVGADVDLTPYNDSGDINSFNIAKAIEAATALSMLPSLQIRLPKKYDSGTSAYERWNSIDWEGLAAELNAIIGTGLDTAVDEFEYYSNNAIFVLSDRGPDAITGE